jgi:hypothetical protein
LKEFGFETVEKLKIELRKRQKPWKSIVGKLFGLAESIVRLSPEIHVTEPAKYEHNDLNYLIGALHCSSQELLAEITRNKVFAVDLSVIDFVYLFQRIDQEYERDTSTMS